jgi:tetratricopeptide (TPR) repeat protein
LCGAGLYPSQVRIERTPAHFEECEQIAREYRHPAAAKWALFHLAVLEPLERGQTLLQELLAHRPQGAIDHYLARYLGLFTQGLGDLEGAEAPLQFSAEGFGKWGIVGEQAYTWNYLADVAAKQGDYARAERLFEQSSELCRRSGLITMLAWTVRRMGALAWQCGDQEIAARHYAESLALAREHAIERHEAWCLVGLARVACERGEYERAKTVCAKALTIPNTRRDLRQVHLPSALARVALCRGQAALAVKLYRESLDRRLSRQGRPSDVEALEALAWALAADGQHELGTWLLACAAREREEMGLVRYPVDRPYQERALAAARVGLGGAAFVAAWAQGKAFSLGDALEAAMGKLNAETQSDR